MNSDRISSDENVHTEYVTLRFNSLVVPALEDRFCVHDLSRKKVFEKTNFGIYPLGSATLPENLVSCILDKDIESFLKMDREVQMYGENISTDPYLPFEREVCVALINDIWCRCLFIQLMGSTKKGMVFSIDYGVIILIDVDDIRVSRIITIQ